MVFPFIFLFSFPPSFFRSLHLYFSLLLFLPWFAVYFRLCWRVCRGLSPSAVDDQLSGCVLCLSCICLFCMWHFTPFCWPPSWILGWSWRRPFHDSMVYFTIYISHIPWVLGSMSLFIHGITVLRIDYSIFAYYQFHYVCCCPHFAYYTRPSRFSRGLRV